MAYEEIKFPFEEKYIEVHEQIPRFRKICSLFNGDEGEIAQAKNEVQKLKDEGLLKTFISYSKDNDLYRKSLQKEREINKKEMMEAKQEIIKADKMLDELHSKKVEILSQHAREVSNKFKNAGSKRQLEDGDNTSKKRPRKG